MNDVYLRALFHQLRAEESLHLPSPRLRGEGAPKGRMRGWAFALIVIVIAIALSYRRPQPPESILTWTAPTDVLLLTPGSELLTTVPRIPDLPERKDP